MQIITPFLSEFLQNTNQSNSLNKNFTDELLVSKAERSFSQVLEEELEPAVDDNDQANYFMHEPLLAKSNLSPVMFNDNVDLKDEPALIVKPLDLNEESRENYPAGKQMQEFATKAILSNNLDKEDEFYPHQKTELQEGLKIAIDDLSTNEEANYLLTIPTNSSFQSHIELDAKEPLLSAAENNAQQSSNEEIKVKFDQFEQIGPFTQPRCDVDFMVDLGNIGNYEKMAIKSEVDLEKISHILAINFPSEAASNIIDLIDVPNIDEKITAKLDYHTKKNSDDLSLGNDLVTMKNDDQTLLNSNFFSDEFPSKDEKEIIEVKDEINVTRFEDASALNLKSADLLPVSKDLDYSGDKYIAAKKNDIVEIAQQIKIDLDQAISNKSSKISIQLTPENLGKIDIQLKFQDDIIEKIEIFTEKYDTLELIEQDIKYLENKIQEITKNSEISFSFNLKDQNKNSKQDSNEFQISQEDIDESEKRLSNNYSNSYHFNQSQNGGINIII